MRRLRAIIIFAAVLSLAMPRQVNACSCAPPDPPAQAFASTNAIFAGTVTQIKSGSRIGQLLAPLRQWLGLAQPPALYGQFAVIQVTQSWKGVQTSPVNVQTDGGAMCGFPFATGQQYVIYAYDGGGSLSASLCSRTAEISQAGADLTFLQTQPTLAVQTALTSRPAAWLGLGAASLIALGLLSAGALWVRRSNQKKEAT